jgi:NAD+ synthetase
MIKVTIAQINPTIGDIEGNAALMLSSAMKARAEHSDMVVFPELSLTGYYPGDLLDEPAFMERVDHQLQKVIDSSLSTPGLTWVVGAPIKNLGRGKKLKNGLLVIRDGRVILDYAKQLLPTYNVFDERRHFEPGADRSPMLRLRDVHIAFMICEDGWNVSGMDYAANPLERIAQGSPDLVVSINASPSNVGKREQRHTLFSGVSRRWRLPILYVNQVGGQDQLVYDGSSFAVSPSQGVCFEAKRFEEDTTTLVFDGETRGFSSANGADLKGVAAMGLDTMEFYRRQIVLGIRDYARRCGFKRTVVGSSGGIDSALTLALAVEALGADNVAAVTMPSEYSSTGSVTDSEVLCANLGVKLHTHPIAGLVSGYRSGFDAAFGQPLRGIALENLQARIRGTILMEYSNSFGHLLLTTGNKSEISVGYATLYGDTNGGLGPIGDLYKTEVFALSKHLNRAHGSELIPSAILTKAPSAELAPGQVDTDSLPPYEILDEILKVLIEGRMLSGDEYKKAQATVDRLLRSDEGAGTVERIKRMVARNEYKRRQSPPILRVRSRAFGSGRQMPIAAKLT